MIRVHAHDTNMHLNVHGMEIYFILRKNVGAGRHSKSAKKNHFKFHPPEFQSTALCLHPLQVRSTQIILMAGVRKI